MSAVCNDRERVINDMARALGLRVRSCRNETELRIALPRPRLERGAQFFGELVWRVADSGELDGPELQMEVLADDSETLRKVSLYVKLCLFVADRWERHPDLIRGIWHTVGDRICHSSLALDTVRRIDELLETGGEAEAYRLLEDFRASLSE